MPTIFFYGPKLDTEKSREMVKEFTDTASRVTGIIKAPSRSTFVIRSLKTWV